MHTIRLAGAIALFALWGCGTAVSDIDRGDEARHVDVEAYQCSAPERCECERAALLSGASAEQARAACG